MKRPINFILLLILVAVNTLAQTPEIRRKQYNLDASGLAIQGYDPVVYITMNKAMEGKKEHSINYKNIIYHFVSKQNKDEFIRNPGHYEPQFGGWCAFAMGKKGEKVEVDPETFRVSDGKLYLFYNKYFNNTLKSWNKDETRLRTQADHNWIKFVP